MKNIACQIDNKQKKMTRCMYVHECDPFDLGTHNKASHIILTRQDVIFLCGI